MSLLLRYLGDHRALWRVWFPLLLLSALAPLLGLGLPLVERRLIDGVMLANRLDRLPQIAALYAGIWLLSTLVLVLGGILRTYLAERLGLLLRQRLFAHCEALSLAFARKEHSGRTMALFMSDVPNLTGLFSTVILGGISSLIALVVGGFIMFRLDPQLALAAAVGPPFVAAAAAVVTRPLRPMSRRVQGKVAELTERLQENLAGLREIVAFAREHQQELRFAATMRELLRLRMRLAALDLTIGSGAGIVSLAVTLTILVYGAYLTAQGQTTLGTVIAMRSLFGLLFQPAGQLVGLVASAQKALASAERIYEFLDEAPGVEDDPSATSPDEVVGEITFEGVGFAYRADQPVLREVSFTAHPGELVALVGPSGAGKSTLVSLIARFYDPDEGRILLDGTDLRDLKLAGLRERIGIVFQDTFLFSATIRENLSFGRAGVSEAEIVAAACAANAWEFIELLPDGLDTEVGERGARLSEGQKQRLAIARALLRDPRILILDEPNSALDARSEHLLNEALGNLMRGRTTFVIAHRLTTARRADRIVVLDDGGIVEQGTHAELLARDGLYRELCDLQLGGARLPLVSTPREVIPLEV